MSADVASRLEEALRKKESAEGYKANLQRLQAEGGVDQENYHRLLDEYEKSMVDAARDLAEVKALISQEIERSDRELAATREELGLLEVRRDVGELAPQQFERSARPLRRRIQTLEASRDRCARLRLAESTADVPSAGSRVPAGFSGKTILGRRISIPAPAAFTEFSSIEDMTTPRFKVVGLASGFLLLISVLAKWMDSDVPGAVPASQVSAWLVMTGLAGVVAAIYASLLVQPQARGVLHLGVAVIGILIVVGVLLTFNFQWATVVEVAGKTIQMPRGAFHFREGLYLYLVALAGMIYYGLKETKADD